MFKKYLSQFKFPHWELAGDFSGLEKDYDSDWGQKLSTTIKEIEHSYQFFISRVTEWIQHSKILFILTAPFIYALWIPGLLMDAFVTIYQTTCFPVYGIPQVKRSDYIITDRHRLSYLSKLEKFNCFFCGYFNGLVAYTREIASRTEQYWCPIKHSKKLKSTHGRYNRFFEYGDSKSYRQGLNKARQEY